jgi:hypothetical protein
MAAPLPAPSAGPVTVPQPVTTTASNDNPTLTAQVRSFAGLGHFCVVYREISFSTIINLRKPLAGKKEMVESVSRFVNFS